MSEICDKISVNILIYDTIINNNYAYFAGDGIIGGCINILFFFCFFFFVFFYFFSINVIVFKCLLYFIHLFAWFCMNLYKCSFHTNISILNIINQNVNNNKTFLIVCAVCVSKPNQSFVFAHTFFLYHIWCAQTIVCANSFYKLLACATRVRKF